MITRYIIRFELIYCNHVERNIAQNYLQLPLRQWGAGNVYLLVLSSWKVNIAENPIAIMGLWYVLACTGPCLLEAFDQLCNYLTGGEIIVKSPTVSTGVRACALNVYVCLRVSRLAWCVDVDAVYYGRKFYILSKNYDVFFSLK